jgi:hypothetical protein
MYTRKCFECYYQIMSYRCLHVITCLGVICRKSQGLEPDYVCSRPENCDSVKDLFKNQTYPDICSFDGLKPIICCVPGNGKTFLLNRTKIEDPIIAKESNICINFTYQID